MALADNDRISSNALNTVISALWTKIKNAFAKKVDLAEVATSGSYDDLSDKPPELFYCYYDVTTAMEIDAAREAGKIPVLMQSESIKVVRGYFSHFSQGNYYFSDIASTGPRRQVYVCGRLVWSTQNTDITASKATIADSASSVEVETRISASGSNFHDTQYALVAPATDATSAAQISCYRFNNGSSSNNSPFPDGMVINIPWSSNFGVQIAIEDESNTEYKRYLNSGTWSSWVQTMTSDGYATSANQADKDADGNTISSTYSKVDAISISDLDTTIAAEVKNRYPKQFIKLWVSSNGGASTISDKPKDGYGFLVIANMIRHVNSSDYRYALTGYTPGQNVMYLSFITQATGSCSWTQVGGVSGDYVNLNSSQTITGVKTFSNGGTNIVNSSTSDHTRLRILKPGETNYGNGVRMQLEYDKGTAGRGLWDSAAGDVLWIGSDDKPIFNGTSTNSRQIDGWTLHFNLRHTPVSQDMWFD